MHEVIDRLLAKAREPVEVREDSGPGWRESADVCALADSERHLGHAVRAGKVWIAYDGMHINPAGDGFRVIGTFETMAAAKQAIEENAGISWARATVEAKPDTGLQQLRAKAGR